MVKVMSLVIEAESALEFSFEVRAQTEVKIRCVTGMYLLEGVITNRFCQLI